MTSPEPPSGSEPTASSTRSPSNSRRIDVVGPPDGVGEDVEPAAVGHADDDVARSVRRGELERLVQHRHHRVEPLDRELLLAEERAAQVALHPFDLRQPPEQRALLLVAERASGSGPTRSRCEATRAPRDSRCARSRRPSSRSRSRAGAGEPRPASRPGRGRAGPVPVPAAWSSGVRRGSSRSGSSAGSPGGSLPSGSRRAARWPCMRCALTSAIAAATAPRSWRRARRASAAAAGAPLPPFAAPRVELADPLHDGARLGASRGPARRARAMPGRPTRALAGTARTAPG